MPLPMGVWCAIAFALGIFAAEHASAPAWSAGALGGAAALSWALGCASPRCLRRGCWWLCMLALGAARVRAVQAPPCVTSLGPAAQGAQTWLVRIEGPCMRRAMPGMRPSVSAPAQLLAVQQSGPPAPLWRPMAGRVPLVLYDDVDIGAGDVLRVPLHVRPLLPARAPWQRSAASRARAEQLSGRAAVLGPAVRLHAGTGVAALCDRLRLRIGRRIDACLPPHVAPLAKAVALGDATSVPSEQRDRFADAGIAHLLAVSGLHVSIVARLCGALIRLALRAGLWPRCAWPARVSACGALIAVWGYATLVGAGVSVMRAAWMATAAMIARALGCGHRGGLSALGLAALCLLVRDPLALFSASALLSFASVWGLLTLSWTRPKRRAGVWTLGLRGLGVVLEGAVASLVTWPICAAWFGRASLIAPLCNLVAIPLGTLLATPASLLLAISLTSPELAPCAAPIGWAAAQSLRALDALAAAAAAPWWAAWVSPPWPTGYIAALALGLGACVLWRRRGQEAPLLRGRRGHAAAALVLSALLIAAGQWALGPATAGGVGVLRVWQLDVGQGDATLIGLPSGGYALVDGGGATWPGARDPGRTVVMPALRALGVRKLDLLLLTHPHPDHMMGLFDVVRQIPVDEFVYNADSARSPCVAQLATSVRARGGRTGRPASSYTFGGASLSVMAAPIACDAPTGAARKRSVNDRSLVVRIAYGATSMLLTGDIEAAAERALAPHVSPVDVLQVSHHGSNTSTTPEWLAAVQPTVAWISCGESNRFGFPHPAVCARLQAVVPHVWSTAARGTLMARSDGRSFVFTCGAGDPC